MMTYFQYFSLLFFPSKNIYTFTGKEKDAETGYSYFGARYYDSDLSGQFLSIDLMSDKYPGISPYAYCAWNPVKLMDIDGKETVSPPWLLIKGIARGIECFSSNATTKSVAYAINNPIIAMRTGIAIDGGKLGISSWASNFSINMTKSANLTMGGIGSHRNAIRHALWQALLTNVVGKRQAKRVGNAHEDDTKVDLSQRLFNNMLEADRAVDLMNNEIGRRIGEQNIGVSNVTMAEKVAEEFYHSGLWTVSEISDSIYKVQKVKLNEGQYNSMVLETNKLNKYGLEKE